MSEHVYTMAELESQATDVYRADVLQDLRRARADRGELLRALERIERVAADVIRDICDQDTGWYYHLVAAVGKAHDAARTVKAPRE